MVAHIFFRIFPIGLGILVFFIARYLWLHYCRTRSDNRELTDARSQLQLVLDNLRDGVVIVNEDRRVMFSNEAAKALISGPAEHRILDPGLGVYDVFSADGAPIPPGEWLVARAFRGSFASDAIVLLRDRSNADVIIREVTTCPFPMPQFKGKHIMMTFRDVTHTRHIEAARTLLASIVESSDDAVIGKDTQGIVTSWNKGAERIFGYTAAEMVGQSIIRLLPPDRLDEETNFLARILQDESVEHFNTTRITKQGRTIHVSLSVSPIKDAAGNIVGASKIARDLTALRDLEDQLRQSQKMEALGQLTGGIAHDFNNLLGIIVGNLDLLDAEVRLEVMSREEGRLKSQQTLQHTHAAQRAALRAADLTRRLLAFSSAEQLKPVLTPLHSAVQNTLSMASRALGPHIEITTHFDPSLPSVCIDPSALESALLNLIVNARDAMPDGGTLSISTRRLDAEAIALLTSPRQLNSDAYACISVSDNGTGMSAETMQRAFDPFFTTKPRGRGTGLGLAMVYGFVKQSNGTVRIYSEAGYGTTVSLYLPLNTLPVERQPAVPLTEPHLVTALTVLLVDDEPELRGMAATYLQRMGYITFEAGDAAAALTLIAKRTELDAMVTDIIMPGGMDGFDLAHRVRELLPNIGIVYTSGFPADALAQRRFTSSSDVLLQKPYRLSELSDALHSALTSRPESAPASPPVALPPVASPPVAP
jgi:PAS domain S-box-containing protein